MEILLAITLVVIICMLIGVYLMLWTIKELIQELVNYFGYIHEIGSMVDRIKKDVYEISNDLFQVRNHVSTMIIQGVYSKLEESKDEEKPKKKRRRRRKKKSNEISLPPKPEDKA